MLISTDAKKKIIDQIQYQWTEFWPMRPKWKPAKDL